MSSSTGDQAAAPAAASLTAMDDERRRGGSVGDVVVDDRQLIGNWTSTTTGMNSTFDHRRHLYVAIGLWSGLFCFCITDEKTPDIL